MWVDISSCGGAVLLFVSHVIESIRSREERETITNKLAKPSLVFGVIIGWFSLHAAACWKVASCALKAINKS
jgi:hypothetical protein